MLHFFANRSKATGTGTFIVAELKPANKKPEPIKKTDRLRYTGLSAQGEGRGRPPTTCARHCLASYRTELSMVRP